MKSNSDQWRTALTVVLAFGSLFVAIRIGRQSWLGELLLRTSTAAGKTSDASPRSNRAPVAVSEPIAGFLDMRDGKPTLYAQANSSVEISAWPACSVAGSTLIRVTLLIDGAERGEVNELARPDVAAAFGPPEFETSGSRATVSLAGIKPSEHLPLAQGIGSRGEVGTLPPFHLEVFE